MVIKIKSKAFMKLFQIKTYILL